MDGNGQLLGEVHWLAPQNHTRLTQFRVIGRLPVGLS
jgi:hypothetical protein